jgi:hypothetical protein
MGFTSKQIDALQQYSEAVDAMLQAFGQNYPKEAAVLLRQGDAFKAWVDSNPVSE